MKKRLNCIIAFLLVMSLISGCGVDGNKLTGSAKGIYSQSGTNSSQVDIQELINQAMQPKVNKYNSMYKKVVRLEWLQEAYINLYNQIYDFANVKLAKYMTSTAFVPMTVESSDSSAVIATANADAIETTHIVRIDSLATNASMISGRIIRSNVDIPDSIFLKDLTDSEAVSGSSLSFSISDDASGNNGSIPVNFISFTEYEIVNQNLTLNDLASEINRQGMNLKAEYNPANDSFSIRNTETGASTAIIISPHDTNGNYNEPAACLLNNLNLCGVTAISDNISILSDSFCFTNDTAAAVYGTDTYVIIDGKSYNSTNNRITVSNVTYSFFRAPDHDIAISVKTDTDAIIISVKSFIEDYNQLIDRLNMLYREEKYQDFDVLTQEEEKEMSEAEIEEWNRKAKSGLLYRDENISDILLKMRESIYTPVKSADSTYNTLMSVGITTLDNTGHLQLNEDKLMQSLQSNSDSLYLLFCSPAPKNGSSANDYSYTGVTIRLYDSLTETLNKIKSYVGTSTADSSTLANMIYNQNADLENFRKLMQESEDKLQEKYDNMETEIARLMSQVSTLTLLQQ